jgi:hypothetical protein
VQLTKEEDLRDLLMIGGIGIFLPLSLEEAEVCIANAAIAEEQSDVIVRKEELEQTLEAAQVDEEEDEHSEESLDVFSEKAEAEEEEEADNICFADLWEQIKSLEERVKVEGMHIQ